MCNLPSLLFVPMAHGPPRDAWLQHGETSYVGASMSDVLAFWCVVIGFLVIALILFVWGGGDP